MDNKEFSEGIKNGLSIDQVTDLLNTFGANPQMKNDIIATEVSKGYINHIDRILERSKLEIISDTKDECISAKNKLENIFDEKK